MPTGRPSPKPLITPFPASRRRSSKHPLLSPHQASSLKSRTRPRLHQCPRHFCAPSTPRSRLPLSPLIQVRSVRPVGHPSFLPSKPYALVLSKCETLARLDLCRRLVSIFSHSLNINQRPGSRPNRKSKHKFKQNTNLTSRSLPRMPLIPLPVPKGK